jgi:hypothetical protein
MLTVEMAARLQGFPPDWTFAAARGLSTGKWRTRGRLRVHRQWPGRSGWHSGRWSSTVRCGTGPPDLQPGHGAVASVRAHRPRSRLGAVVQRTAWAAPLDSNRPAGRCAVTGYGGVDQIHRNARPGAAGDQWWLNLAANGHEHQAALSSTQRTYLHVRRHSASWRGMSPLPGCQELLPDQASGLTSHGSCRSGRSHPRRW